MVDSIQQQPTDNNHLQSRFSPATNQCDSNHQWQEFDVGLKRTWRSRFGFSIIGGNEYSPAISIGYIEQGGVADCDGRLKLDDIILHVNKISFKAISHEKAVRELRSVGRHITMRIRRSVPCITEEIPLCTQNNSPRFSNVHSKLNEIGNNDIVTRSSFNDQSRQSVHDILCVNKKSMNQLRNSESESHTISKPLKEFEVGTYEDLKRRLLRRIDLIIHRLIQPDIASTIIPEYKESEAICIALHNSKYHSILTMSQNQIKLLLSNYSSKKILAYAIGCSTEPRTIPNPVLLEAIQLHCQKFPHIYKKATQVTLRQDFSTINWDGNELVSRIPYMDPSFVGTTQDVMKYGNCVKDLSVKVRRFLEETGTSELCSWENADLSGKYLVHQDIYPLTGRSRFLIVHIKLDHSETHKEETDDSITTTTTYYHKIKLTYE